MEKYLKRGLLTVTVIAVVGIVVTWVTAQPVMIQAPEVTSITSETDGSGRIRLFRVWSDGLTEYSVKMNGSDYSYSVWVIITE